MGQTETYSPAVRPHELDRRLRARPRRAPSCSPSRRSRLARSPGVDFARTETALLRTLFVLCAIHRSASGDHSRRLPSTPLGSTECLAGNRGPKGGGGCDGRCPTSSSIASVGRPGIRRVTPSEVVDLVEPLGPGARRSLRTCETDRSRRGRPSPDCAAHSCRIGIGRIPPQCGTRAPFLRD
jgi:hypothetical protein